MQGGNGSFYGATRAGGNWDAGTVYSLTPAGALTTVFAFSGSNGLYPGIYPWSGLVDGGNGNFLGTTLVRDNHAGSTIFSFDIAATHLSQSITWAQTGNLFLQEGSLALTARASSSLPITYSLRSGPATLDGNILTPTNYGAVVIQASQAGNERFNPAPTVESSFQIVSRISMALESGFAITWNGNNGDHSGAAESAGPPPIAALNARAIGSSQLDLGGIHTIAHISDGYYGNNHSWISANGLDTRVDADPWIGVAFGSPIRVDKIAWSRDNGNDAEGVFSDRATGVFTLQFTQIPSPGSAEPEATDPRAGWATIGQITIAGSIDTAVFAAHLRHEFVVSQNDQPIEATGIRLKEPTGKVAIDELEVYVALAQTTMAAKRNDDGTITLEWSGGGALLGAPSMEGPWTEMIGATSPYKVTPDAAQGAAYYRVRQ